MSEEGIHVASGTFRVDRGRALEKLKDFQLQDPGAFCLPWLRCAAASGAKTVELASTGGALEFRFDGRPFEARDLQDPYACLLGDDTDSSTRNRYFAMGLLAALRQGPKSIEVRSGEGKRLRLAVTSIEQDALTTEEGGSGPTVIEVRFGRLGGWLLRSSALQKARESCRMFPSPVTVSGVRADGPPSADLPTLVFEEKGQRLMIAVPDDPRRAESSVRLYKHGVLVSSFDPELPYAACEAHVNDDEFALDASQGSVVKNKRFEAASAFAASHVDELLIAAAAAQARLYSTQLGPAMRKAALGGRVARVLTLAHWANPGLLEALLSRLPFAAKDGELRRLIRWESRVGAWLRRAAEGLKPGDQARERSPALTALWGTPLFLAADGRPLSLKDIGEQEERIGYVPFSTAPLGAEGELPMSVVWAPTPTDRACLTRQFPEKLRDLSSVVRSFRRLAQKTR